MRVGLALPQYDYSVPGESPLRWDTLLDHAERAEALGFDSLWLSDHLFLDIAKYGGPAEPYGIYEPLVTLAALARTVTRPRLGTLVACEALRPASVLAKALATLDRICAGRLDVGLGAGWYAPEYEAVGLASRRPVSGSPAWPRRSKSYAACSVGDRLLSTAATTSPRAR